MLKKSLPILIVIAALALALPMFVAAQSGPPDTAQRFGMAAAAGNGWRGGNRGAARGGWLTGGVSMVDATAQAAEPEMEVADVIAALREGQTFADLADPQDIVDEMIAVRKDALAQAVTDGRFTQEQADAMLVQMEADLLARTGEAFEPRGAGNGYALNGTRPMNGAGFRGGNGQGKGLQRGPVNGTGDRPADCPYAPQS